MFNADIKFIILSIDIQDSKLVHYVLSSDKNQFQYPSCSISDTISISEAKKICFENYVSLKLEWIEHRLLDVAQEKDIISIYYVCSIPIESKVVNGIFMPINKIVADTILQKGIRTA
jgi:hypothetical protein